MVPIFPLSEELVASLVQAVTARVPDKDSSQMTSLDYLAKSYKSSIQANKRPKVDLKGTRGSPDLEAQIKKEKRPKNAGEKVGSSSPNGEKKPTPKTSKQSSQPPQVYSNPNPYGSYPLPGPAPSYPAYPAYASHNSSGQAAASQSASGSQYKTQNFRTDKPRQTDYQDRGKYDPDRNKPKPYGGQKKRDSGSNSPRKRQDRSYDKHFLDKRSKGGNGDEYFASDAQKKVKGGYERSDAN